MNFGFFEVVSYFMHQAHGFDLANMAMVKRDRGWIIFDVLLTSKTVVATFDLATEYLGQFPVITIVYSHSHIYNFGDMHRVINEHQALSGATKLQRDREVLLELASVLATFNPGFEILPGTVTLRGYVDTNLHKSTSKHKSVDFNSIVKRLSFPNRAGAS